MARVGLVTRIRQRRVARTRTLAVAVAAALAGAVTSCAAVPTGGAPQKVTGGSGQPQAYALPMPPPAPQADWSKDDVVLGFLHASASFAANWAAARTYLTPRLRARWKPGAVTVVAPPSPASFKAFPHQESGPGGPTQAVVTFSGQRLATLTTSGQYLYEPGNPVYSFTLVKKSGVWRIDSLPTGLLLLTQVDFQDVYQPSNLFFFAPLSLSVPQGDPPQTGAAPRSLAALLVPDPVYAPIQGTTRTTSASNATLATSLVKGLLRGPGSWLANNATWSAFPAGTTLIGNQVRISGQTAIVNLGGKALTAGDTAYNWMDEQLLATLADSSYSPPVARSVLLEVGGKVHQYRSNVANLIPRVGIVPQASQAPVFFQSGRSSVSQLVPRTAPPPGKSAKPTLAAGPAQIDHSAVTAVAASNSYNSPQMLAIAANVGRGCTVYAGISGGSRRYQQYLLSRTGGACTSMSWDRNGNLWVTAAKQVWLIEPRRAPVPISLPAWLSVATAAARKGPRVLALRMAPDGIRAAFLVQTATGNRLLLAAVRTIRGVVSFGPAVSVGTGLPNARSVSWYNAYNLVVLAGSEVYEVPLTGGPGQQRPLGAAPDRAQSITTNGTVLVAGTAGGDVRGAANFLDGWRLLTKGQAPAYPG
jgi:Lipoprotein LpqB beta-propeller domain/Sporulation and spore germination